MPIPVPAVPSLSNVSRPLLKSKENVALYLIEFLFSNPGKTSSHAEGEMVSFRRLVAEHGSMSKEVLADKIGEMLTTSLGHYFPNDDLRAVCSITEEMGVINGVYQGNYSITIAMQDRDGIPIIPNRLIHATKDGSAFVSIYDKEI